MARTVGAVGHVFAHNPACPSVRPGNGDFSSCLSRRLDPPVDETRDHILGASDAPITLVEYGSYACPHCRVANETIASLCDRFGDRIR
ncbi:thioredoxin domain-containing protein [Mesorhizobium sp. M0166]|uniref:thioredoxin domain-containing protein n=1 Tax=Mesorhizobium sp. M0166 TaxID=2956902 RepID=UPI00333B85BA